MEIKPGDMARINRNGETHVGDLVEVVAVMANGMVVVREWSDWEAQPNFMVPAMALDKVEERRVPSARQ